MKYLFLLLFTFSAFASGDHHHDGKDGQDGINGTNGINASTLYKDAAIAAASASGGHQFDYRTHKFQWSVVGVNYRGKLVHSGALAKQFGSTLITGSLTSESNFSDLEDLITMISAGGTF